MSALGLDQDIRSPIVVLQRSAFLARASSPIWSINTILVPGLSNGMTHTCVNPCKSSNNQSPSLQWSSDQACPPSPCCLAFAWMTPLYHPLMIHPPTLSRIVLSLSPLLLSAILILITLVPRI